MPRSTRARLIDGLAPGDTMTLVDAGTTARVLVTSDDHATLLRLLPDLRQGYGASSLAQDGPLLAGLTASNRAQAHTDLFVPVGTASGVVRSLRATIAPLRVHVVGASSADRGRRRSDGRLRCRPLRSVRPPDQHSSARHRRPGLGGVDDGHGAPRQGARPSRCPRTAPRRSALRYRRARAPSNCGLTGTMPCRPTTRPGPSCRCRCAALSCSSPAILRRRWPRRCTRSPTCA